MYVHASIASCERRFGLSVRSCMQDGLFQSALAAACFKNAKNSKQQTPKTPNSPPPLMKPLYLWFFLLGMIVPYDCVVVVSSCPIIIYVSPDIYNYARASRSPGLLQYTLQLNRDCCACASVKQDRFPPCLSFNVVCTPILLIPVHVLGPDVGVRLVCESW
jgi:hypothetical protein